MTNADIVAYIIANGQNGLLEINETGQEVVVTQSDPLR